MNLRSALPSHPTRRRFLQTAGVAAAGVALGAMPRRVRAQSTRDRLNILLIVADDAGKQMGCYGDDRARTPHLDRLAAEGVRFTRTYVTPSCSPTRASLFTGLYTHQHNHIGVTGGSEDPWYQVHRGIPMLPTLLKDAGYRRGVIGKKHVEPGEVLDDLPHVPLQGASPRNVLAVGDAAQQFMGESDQPFFLMINFNDPHTPWKAQEAGRKGGAAIPADPLGPDDVEPLDWWGPWPERFGSRAIREELARYYNEMTRLDAGVGALMDALQKTGKAATTLVVFISDNGPDHIRGKMTIYEHGTNVPMIVRHPQLPTSRRGAVEDGFVSVVDFVPTFLAAAGVAYPGPTRLPGQSILPLVLRGEPVRDRVFTEMLSHVPKDYNPQMAVRDERYKLILNLDAQGPKTLGSTPISEAVTDVSLDDLPEPMRAIYATPLNPPMVELYGLQADPHEFHNLADEPGLADVKARLLDELAQWRRETNDPFQLASVRAEWRRVHDNIRPSGRYGRIDAAHMSMQWPVDLDDYRRKFGG